MRQVEEQEAEILQNLSAATAFQNSTEFLSLLAQQAWNVKAYKEPAFQLYTNKKLVLLSFMEKSGLLDVSDNIPCAIEPKHLNAQYARAIPLFIWANNFTPSIVVARLPRFKLSVLSRKMENLSDYLDLLEESKNSYHRIRSLTTDVILDRLEKRIFDILNTRRVNNKDETEGRNNVIAKWALMQTSAPENIWDFWFALLTKEPKLLYTVGAILEAGEKPIVVRMADLRELQQHMLDNLVIPNNEDGSYYYDACHVTFGIVNKAIDYFKEQDASFALAENQTPVLSGDDLFSAATTLSMSAPKREDFKTLLLYNVAMAMWRVRVRTESLKQSMEKPVENKPNKDGNYDFL